MLRKGYSRVINSGEGVLAGHYLNSYEPMPACLSEAGCRMNCLASACLHCKKIMAFVRYNGILLSIAYN